MKNQFRAFTIALNISVLIVFTTFGIFEPVSGYSFFLFFIAITSALNIYALSRIQKKPSQALRLKTIYILCNICVALIGLFFFLASHKLEIGLGAWLITTSTLSITAFRAKNGHLTIPPQSSLAPERIKHRSREKLYGEIKTVSSTLGMATIFFLIFLAKDSWSAPTKAERLTTVLPYALLMVAICFIVWYIAKKRQMREANTATLLALGIDGAEAKEIALREEETNQAGNFSQNWWHDYYNRNRKEIDDIQEKFSRILVQEYNIKPEAAATPANNIPPAARIHFLKTPPEFAAMQLYMHVIKSGNSNNPKIFNASEEAGKPKPSLLNKLLYGAYAPTKEQKAQIIIFLMMFALFIYSITGAIIGPNIDLFLPTGTWHTLGLIGSIGLAAIYLIGFIVTYNKRVKCGEATAFSPTRQAFSWLIVGPALFLLFYFGLVFGAGELVTELIGQEKTQSYLVSKDPKTERILRSKYGSRTVKAHCVSSEDFEPAIISEEFCLQKQHYDQLPAGKSPLSFQEKESIFGTVIYGYLMPLD